MRARPIRLGAILACAALTPSVPAAAGELVVEPPELDREQDSDIYRKNLSIGALSLVSTNLAGGKGNDSSSAPAVSGDGRLIAFASRATNLDPEPAGRWQPDDYVKNLATGYVGSTSGLAAQEPSGVLSLYPAAVPRLERDLREQRDALHGGRHKRNGRCLSRTCLPCALT